MKKFLVLLLLAPLPVQAQLSQSGILLDCIAAVVNEGVVLHSELSQQLGAVRRGLGAQGVALPPERILREQVLESLVLKRIQLQRAELIGLSVSDEDVNRSMAMIAERNGIALSQLPAALASDGIDYTMFREEARDEMTLEQLRMRDVVSRITISRGELEQALASDESDDKEFEVYHLLIAVDQSATEEQAAQAEAQARELYDRLVAGEEFGPLAVTYSDAPGVLQSRGSLGFRPAAELPSIMAEQVPQLEPGETAEPFRSASGFHIIQLNDVRGAEKVIIEQRRARHILIQPNEVVSEADALQKISSILARIEAGEDFAGLAEAESDDEGTARRGGDLGWAGPGTFVEAFEQQIAQLQPGELSKPFRSPYGYHIVELLETRRHDSTEEVRRNQAAASIRTRKFEEEAQSWLRQLRDEAYVEKREACINT